MNIFLRLAGLMAVLASGFALAACDRQDVDEVPMAEEKPALGIPDEGVTDPPVTGTTQ